MVFKRKKMALYEVLGKTGTKPRSGKIPVQPPPQGASGHKSDTTSFPVMPPGRAARWPSGPKMLLFSAGRVEISLPYQIAIAILLGLILLILVAFRLGQNLSSKTVESSVVVPKDAQKLAESPVVGSTLRRSSVQASSPQVEAPEKAEPVKKVSPVVQKPAAADTKSGNNRIVIQTWWVKEQLEPVKEYFAKCGIETEIIKESEWYYLVTKEKYDNPDRPSTDGYTAKQKIIELGAKYELPPGLANFGPEPFHDAYGKRFNE